MDFFSSYNQFSSSHQHDRVLDAYKKWKDHTWGSLHPATRLLLPCSPFVESPLWCPSLREESRGLEVWRDFL